MKNNKKSSINIIICGDNNTININNEANIQNGIGTNTVSHETWFKALGKLIRSAFVNISVLLLEIFAKLG